LFTFQLLIPSNPTPKHEEDWETLAPGDGQKMFMYLIPGHMMINKESFALTSVEMLQSARKSSSLVLLRTALGIVVVGVPRIGPLMLLCSPSRHDSETLLRRGLSSS
jgi:hypothetical protein